MADFSSGVKRFIKAQATVVVNFPVDWRDNESICCKQCQYLSSNERMCQLNKEPVAYPNKYVGHACPLSLVEESENDVQGN